MRKLILGKQGTGKTTLIVNEIIPTLGDNYRVVDFCDEYSQWIDESRIIKYGPVQGAQLKSAVIATIREMNKDTVLIIDNAEQLYFPKASCPKDLGFEWLELELERKQYVLVFQSIERVLTGGIGGTYNPELYEEVIIFITRDDAEERERYLDALKRQAIGVFEQAELITAIKSKK